MLKHHNKQIGFLVFFVISLIFLGFALFSGSISLLTPSNIEEFITAFGIFAPIIFIIVGFIRVIFPIVPGSVMDIISGYLFGTVFGIIYSYIAVFFASLFSFYLSRKLGRNFIKRFIHGRDLKHLNHFIKKKGIIALIVVRLIPFFPADAVNFVSGISKLTYKQFIIGTLVGLAPGLMVFNMFGSNLASGNFDFRLVLFLIILALAGIFYMFRHEMKIFFIKEIRMIENYKK